MSDKTRLADGTLAGPGDTIYYVVGHTAYHRVAIELWRDTVEGVTRLRLEGGVAVNADRCFGTAESALLVERANCLPVLAESRRTLDRETRRLAALDEQLEKSRGRVE